MTPIMAVKRFTALDARRRVGLFSLDPPVPG